MEPKRKRFSSKVVAVVSRLRGGGGGGETTARGKSAAVPARERADAAPQLLLASLGAAPAEVVLATIWLPDDSTA